jgi:O-antigen ligase
MQFRIFSAAVILVVVGRLHDAVSPVTGVLPIVKPIALWAYLQLLLSTSKQTKGTQTWSWKGLLIFVFAMALSVPFAIVRSSALEFFLTYLFVNLPIYFALLYSIRGIGELEWIAKCMTMLCVFSAILLKAGLGQSVEEMLGARAFLLGMYDSNELALLIVTAAPFCLWVLRWSSVAWRVVAIGGVLSVGYILNASASRGGFLAIVAVAIGLAFLRRPLLHRSTAILAIPLLVAASLLASETLKGRVQTLFAIEQDYNVSAESGRLAVWRRGVDHFLSRPLTGVGVVQYENAEGRWGEQNGRVRGFKWSAAHNMYLQSAAEMGLVGLTGLLLILIPGASLGWMVVSTRGQNGKVAGFAAATGLACVAYLIGGTFLSAALMPMLPVLAVCISSILLLFRQVQHTHANR